MENEEIFRFLFDLQRSGRINMLGAAPYLMNRFGEQTRSKRRAIGLV